MNVKVFVLPNGNPSLYAVSFGLWDFWISGLGVLNVGNSDLDLMDFWSLGAPLGVLKVGDRFFWNLSFFDIGGSDLGIEGLATF